MKIYFLRHEDRYKAHSFFTPLSLKGKKNSIKLVYDLLSLKITQVYSSPFIRTLQTIEPFIKKSKLKVKLENSLREFNTINSLPKRESKLLLPEELHNQFNIDSKYKSFLKLEEIIYPEEESNLKRRFNNFLKNILEKYKNTDDNILIVSHAGLIEGFIRKLEKKKDEFKYLKRIKPYNYPLGRISLIVENNKLVFHSINWNLI